MISSRVIDSLRVAIEAPFVTLSVGAQLPQCST
jgi:hypothetical protein